MTIIIEAPHADFTPKGKRTARVVKTSNGGHQLRWSVSGRIFRKLAVTRANCELTDAWLTSTTTHEIDDFNYVGSRHHY